MSKISNVVRITLILLAGASWIFGMCGPAFAQDDEPIAFIGHGAFFDSAGNQIVPTEEFIRGAMAWYRDDLLPRVPAEKRETFLRQEEMAGRSLGLTGREQLVLESRTVDWLMENAEKEPGR